MSNVSLGRARIVGLALLTLVVACAACRPGQPAGQGGVGAPYVWACTPANYANAGSTNGTLHVFNGGGASANVAVNFLNKDGANLAGQVVPGAVPPNPGDPAPTYPGQSGATTVAVAPANTLVVNWLTAQGNPAAGGAVPATIRVTSDQPVAVGIDIVFSGFHVIPCSYVHR